MDEPRSSELRPGTRVRFRNEGWYTLDRRKTPDDVQERHSGLPYHPGWWLREGGGLADFVIDDPNTEWTIVAENSDG